MASDPAPTWSPPVYDLSTAPELKCTYAIQDESNNQNFARSAKWTPDGSVFMAHCEDRTLQLFNTYTSPTSTPPPARPTLVLPQPAPILDFTWYPTASPHDPASFCFLASVRECPVKLLDASDGRLRASYKIVDHIERFVAPHCMTFNLDASKVYCGHEDAIEVFDISRPGEGSRIFTTPSRKSKDGLKGIVSALAFSPQYSTASDAFYATGTLHSTPSNLAIYTDSQADGVPLMFVGGGLRSGITQICFNPMRPHIMYAAYRRRDTVLAWDLRADVNTPFARYVVSHKPTTNQKILFDVDISGKRLVVGDQGGSISVFDLSDGDGGSSDVVDFEETVVKRPDLVFDAHSDSIGSVAFHPYNPTLLSVSGSRHYDDLDSKMGLVSQEGDSGSDSDASDDDRDDDDHNDDIVIPIQRRERLQPTTTDSSIKIWGFRSKTDG